MKNMTDEKRLCTGNIVGDYTKNKYLYDEAVVQANKLNLTEEVFHLKALSIIINDIVIKTLARIGIDLLAQKTGLVSNCHKIIGCFILSNEPRIAIVVKDSFTAVIRVAIAQFAVLILASIGRDVLAQKCDAISATSKSGDESIAGI